MAKRMKAGYTVNEIQDIIQSATNTTKETLNEKRIESNEAEFNEKVKKAQEENQERYDRHHFCVCRSFEGSGERSSWGSLHKVVSRISA